MKNILENRLKYYESSSRFKLPLEGTYKDLVVIITVVQYESSELSDNKKESNLNWSDEIFSHIVESLKDLNHIKKIIVGVLQQDIIRTWIVIGREDEKTEQVIYEREIAIIKYISNFGYDIDFHIITEDMTTDILDENSKVIFEAKKLK